MTKSKDLEHEGCEDFLSFPDRKKVAKTIAKKEKKIVDEEHERKVAAQEKWLSVNNPLIFDGDYDA